MGRVRRPRYWLVFVAGAVVLGSLLLASYSIGKASEKGADARSALCEVLLFVRQTGLQRSDRQPMTPEQQRQFDAFYDRLIGLVDGCEIPKVPIA